MDFIDAPTLELGCLTLWELFVYAVSVATEFYLSSRCRIAAASAVTHPQQLLVLLLQLAFQVPHPLLDAPVTLLRLHADHSIDETGIC